VCRHFAWVGAPKGVRDLVFGPTYGLFQQAAVPRWQREGIVNSDGFGVGWYDGSQPGTVRTRYRRAKPIWTDVESLTAVVRDASAPCLLGAVRSATPGMPIEEAATAPFTDGRLLLSHNGHFDVGRVRAALGSGIDPDSRCDSAFLASLLWHRAAEAPSPGNLGNTILALVEDILRIDSKACLNLLVTDGTRVIGTTWGETLCYRLEADGAYVASEPLDDRPDWVRVDDRRVVYADQISVNVKPL
jgi:glutamine amidotransferase